MWSWAGPSLYSQAKRTQFELHMAQNIACHSTSYSINEDEVEED